MYWRVSIKGIYNIINSRLYVRYKDNGQSAKIIKMIFKDL